MLNHLKFRQKHHKLQIIFYYFSVHILFLHCRYCPHWISERHNVEHTKVTDVKILTLLCLQVTLDVKSQHLFCYLMATNPSITFTLTGTQRLLPVSVITPTKKISLYSFKTHTTAIIDTNILNYVITAASIHDAKAVPEPIL